MANLAPRSAAVFSLSAKNLTGEGEINPPPVRVFNITTYLRIDQSFTYGDVLPILISDVFIQMIEKVVKVI